MVYAHDIQVIFDPAKPQKQVYMYTVGLDKANRQELCAFDVPRNCVDQVGKLINHLSTCTLLPNETAGFEYPDSHNEVKVMAFRLIKPSKARRKRIGLVHHKAEVLELVSMTPWPTTCYSKALQCECCGVRGCVDCEA
eukprot:6955498-Prymnesium_polylepis.2